MTKIAFYSICIFQYILYFFSRILFYALYGGMSRPIALEGLDSPLIITANHLRVLDPFMIIGSMPFSVVRRVFPIKIMTARSYYVFTLPIAFMAGCFSTRPVLGISKSSGTNGALYFLDKGYSLLIFPEGKRVKRQRITAKKGVLKINKNSHSPLLTIKIAWDPKLEVIMGKIHTKKFTDADLLMDEIYSL